MGYFALKKPFLQLIYIFLPKDIICWSLMSSCAKFQNDPFIRSIVFRKNVKRTFLSPEPIPDDFSKILFYGDTVNNGTCLCIEFHDCQLNSLEGEDSQRNHRSWCIRALLSTLALLNNNEWEFSKHAIKCRNLHQLF